MGALNMTLLSVVVPLAPGEESWRALSADLALLPDGAEVLFVGSEDPSSRQESTGPSAKMGTWLFSSGSRAGVMNAGADAAKGEFLWFLHADSKFGPDAVSALYRAVRSHPESLHYFNLAFFGADARLTRLMRMNEWGARVRSWALKVPFGDQGFCISKSLFKKVGGFPEGMAYGEDRAFVMRARGRGIKVRSTGATLYTSDRKYKNNGWLKTTLLHQYRWIKLAWPSR
ncbi:MAG: glycosyltransferase [Nitrospinae bacterium]|nr:glycosyltransferase [Nitrospinota bacterium]